MLSMASGCISRARNASRSFFCCWSILRFSSRSSSIRAVSASEAISMRSSGRNRLLIVVLVALYRPGSQALRCQSGRALRVPGRMSLFGLRAGRNCLNFTGGPCGFGLMLAPKEPLDLHGARQGNLTARRNDLQKPLQVLSHASREVGISREHRWDRLDCAPLVEKQQEELLPHQGLERRKRDPIAALVSHALKQRETALVHDAVRHSDVEKGADDSLPRSAFAATSFELVYAPLDQRAVGTVLARPAPRAPIGGLQTNQSLQERRPVNAVEQLLAHPVSRISIAVEHGLFLIGQPLLRLPVGIVRSQPLPALPHRLRDSFHSTDERIGIREHFVLQPQGVQPAHPFRETLVGPAPDPGLHERAIETEIDVGYASRRSKPPFVLLVIAAKRSNVAEAARFEAHQIVAADQVGANGAWISRRHHGLVKARRQHIDKVDVARELIVLLLRHRSRYEDAEMAYRLMDGINHGLTVRPHIVDAVVEIEDPVQRLLRRRDVVALRAEHDDRRADVA